jgi:hypothetical protein
MGASCTKANPTGASSDDGQAFGHDTCALAPKAGSLKQTVSVHGLVTMVQRNDQFHHAT